MFKVALADSLLYCFALLDPLQVSQAVWTLCLRGKNLEENIISLDSCTELSRKWKVCDLTASRLVQSGHEVCLELNLIILLPVVTNLYLTLKSEAVSL